MNPQRQLTVRDLKHALLHIHALILDEREIFDDAGALKETLRKAEIIFDDTDHHLIQDLQSEIKHLQELIFKDELTGILNRRGVMDHFGALFDEALFAKQKPGHRKSVVINDFSIIFLDIDDFKKINDTYGHDEGDRVLRELSHVLQKHIRHIDAVGRLGGEEFVIALLGADEDRAQQKANEIRKDIMDTVLVGPRHEPATASFGVASLRHSNAEKLTQLIEYADKAMYQAKQTGKNKVVLHSSLSS